MKRSLIAFLLFSTVAAGQEDSLQKQAFQVSFIYSLGTNGTQSPSVTNTVSFNILAGLNGGVQGMEIGGIANVNKGAVVGWQIGGVANITKGTASGVIIGGVANVIGDSSSGCFVAGISNVIGGNTSGMYVAGISNSNAGNLIGTQVAGISNFCSGNTSGVQISGVSNVVLGDLTGVQVGLVNVTRRTNGVQLGLINVSDAYDKGIPIGLFSFVKKGYHAVEVSAGDAIPINAALKFGVRRFYNTYKFGVLLGNEKVGFTMGLGVGTHIALTEKWNLSLELSTNQVVKNFNDNGLESLTQGTIQGQFNLGRFSVFAGPSINMLTEASGNANSRQIHVPYTIYSRQWDYYQGKSSWWIGANAGVAFAF